MAGRYHSRKEKRKFYKSVGITLAVFVAACVLVMVAVGMADRKETGLQDEPKANLELTEIGGTLYLPKKNIETYLFMGIDDMGPVRKKEEYDGTGQCDVLILLVRDLGEGTYRTLVIDRNTMTDVKSLDTDGTYLATTRNQISLAHSDGDGLEMSCENTVDAVSNLLYGQKIDGYAAVNMGAIRTVNHLVGGITVTIEDDFSKYDPSLKMGETIVLNDEQAEHFIRGRMEVGDGTNEGRIRRQSAYLSELKPKLKTRCGEDGSFPMELYEALGEYMVTNISAKKFSKIALLVAKEKDAGELKIDGTDTIGEMEFVEFEPDPESLAEAVTTLFYKKYEGE